MYVEHNIVARSRNNCCHGNAIMRSIFIVVDLHVAVNYIKLLSVATKTQQWASFALLLSYKIFRTVWGSNPGGGEIFCTRPDRVWGPPSLLYNG
jgi:hypothetical protein